MRTVYIAILIAAMLPLAVGGWIVEGGRKILSPRPRLTPRASGDRRPDAQAPSCASEAA